MTACQATSPLKNSAPPSSPRSRTFIGELYNIPVVKRVCQKVVSLHATLGRVVPFYSRFFTIVLFIASALAHRVGQWRFVRTIVQRGDAIGLLVLDNIRRLYLHPKLYLRKLMNGVRGVVMRGAARLAVHPIGRLPCRIILWITGRIQSLLEALKLNDEKPYISDMFIIGRLQLIYNQCLATLTVRVKTFHCALENLLKEIKDSEVNTNLGAMKNANNGSRHGSRHKSSSSDDEPSEPLQTPLSKDDELNEKAFSSP